jgi:uncharacterized repeat protein (TIGR01451 family)
MISRQVATRRSLPVSRKAPKNRRARLGIESLDDRITPSVDLMVTMNDGGVTATPGGTIVYSLTLKNVGTTAATGITISETVPANTTFNALASDPDWNATGTAWGPIGIMRPGDSTTITYAVTVDATLPVRVDQISNTVTVADDGSNGPDANPVDNSATDTTPVNAAPEISILNTDAGATSWPSGTITYILFVKNNGNQDASGVVVSESVPTNTTFNAAASAIGWNAAGTSYTIGDLPAGTTQTFVYAVNVDVPFPAGVTEISNTATVADDGTNGADPNPNNNTSTDTTPIVVGSISDRVWLDFNANGVADAGEPGIPNVGVQLTWFGPDGVAGGGDDVVFHTTTDANGNYSFSNLPPGNFQVDVDPATLPEPLVPTFDADGIGTPNTVGRTLAPGESVTSLDFGYAGTGSIGDRIWNDSNNDGIQGGGETGLNGVTVHLTWAGPDGNLGTGDDISTTAVTSGDGNYQFNNLPAGNYIVAVDPATLPAGFVQTGDPDGNLDNQTVVHLASGQVKSDVDFGYSSVGSIGVLVYRDLNVSGTFNAGEPGIGSVTFHVTGQTNTGGSVAFDVQTQPDGTVVIGNLAPGTYRIAEVQPAGYLDKDETVGGVGGTTIGTLDGNDAIKDIVVGAGQNLTGYNFGELLPSSIRGFVYVDANNNGLKEGGEAKIFNVLVTLTGTDDRGASVSIPGRTDLTGHYSFDNLRPGTYSVTETQPRSVLDGRDTVGTPAFGATATTNDKFTGFKLPDGSVTDGNNFGELPLGTQIDGYVYVDANSNGRKDPGEKGIGGVTVRLVGTDDLGHAVRKNVVTDSAGRYRFLQLRPGTYSVNEIQPSTFVDGIESLGSLGGVAKNDSFRSVSVRPGDVGDNYNFGERGFAQVSKRLFFNGFVSAPVATYGGSGWAKVNLPGTGDGIIIP